MHFLYYMVVERVFLEMSQVINIVEFLFLAKLLAINTLIL